MSRVNAALWWQYGEQQNSWAGLGLIGILAVIAAVVLLVTGRYPEQIFDFVLGMNRWVLRVAGYAGLMTDRYPPFRLDMGGHDPGTLTLQPVPGSSPQGLPEVADLRQASPQGPGGWTGGRIVAAVAGVPHAGHTQGLATAPRAWETHVIGFLNAALKPYP